MPRLAFGELKLGGSGQPLDHFALRFVEFCPRFQTSFFTTRTSRI